MSAATMGGAPLDFFERLRQMGVSLELEGTNLKASAPPGVISAGLREELSRRKSELIALLQSRPLRRPLSPAESRLWYLQTSAPDSVAYNLWKAVRITGRLNPPGMRSALVEVIARHEILRTTYEMGEGAPEAVIHRQPRLEWAVREVAGEEQARKIASEPAARPFALHRGPLIRGCLLRWRADEQILVLALHHMVADGPSLELLWNEASQIYETYQNGGCIELPQLELQYSEWAESQRQELASERAARDLEFWRAKLAGGPGVLEFPGARRRPAATGFRGAWERIQLPAASSAAVQQLAAEERATPFAVLLSAFLLLIARSVGTDDICVGTPVTGRRDRQTEPLIGLFANMLALRFRIDGDVSFRQFLRQVRDECLEYFEHAATPIEDVIQKLRLKRDPAVSPLFQIAFLCEVFRERPTLVSVPVENGSAKFDLTLAIEMGPAGVDCALEYSTDLYDHAVAQRILANFGALAEAAIHNPDLSCGRIPLPGSPEAATVGPRTAYPGEPVHKVFEKVAAGNAEREALVCDGVRVTYGELNRRANFLAGFLAAQGVRPRSTVATLMDRSVDYVAALLAILKCGAVWAPFAPSDPPLRTADLIDDCGAALVLCQTLPHRLQTQAKIEILPHWDGRTDPGSPSAAVSIDRPACVMYTSGSTGAPKGVLVTHKGILRLLFGVDYAALGPETVTLFHSPLQFDASTFELFGALLHGGRAVIARQGFTGLQEFADLLKRESVNTCWLTASLFNAVVDQSVDALKPLSQLLIGGEALSTEHVRRALDGLPETRIVNGYGPTESTTFACCHRISGPIDRAARSVPIGRPIANTQAMVLDRLMQPLPPCALGELYIGGDGLAEGYLNAQALTAERFVRAPGFAGPLYRSGDLAFVGPDNLLYFAGRADEQVKIRGYRVEPGEVEAAVRRLPEIQQAVVMAQPDSSGALSLVAYYVARAGSRTAEEGVLEALRGSLPAHMVPSRAFRVPVIPLKPSGKVDRAALQAMPGSEKPAQGVAHVSPAELRLLQIWHKFFPGRQISVEDDFFNLGGHSLMAVRLMAQIERQFGKRLPASLLFEAPTVRALAVRLAAVARETRSAPEFAALQPLGDRPPLFFVGAGPKQRLFAQRLGAEQPCLSPVPRFHHDYGPEFLMDLVAQYAADIRSIQPHGPYFLAGWSRCGLLALEIAQALRASGGEVALVVLVDTCLPEGYRGIGVRDRVSARAATFVRFLRALRRVPELIHELTSRRMGQRVSEALAYVQQSALGRFFWNLRSAVSRKVLGRRVVIEGWHDLAWALNASAQKYVPRRYDSPVLFLLAKDKPAGSAYNSLQGWERYLADYHVEAVPGDHETMFRPPHVDEVAAAVRRYL